MDRRSLLAGIVGQGYSVVAAPALTDGAVPAQIGRTLAGGSDQAGQPKTPDGARSSDVVRRVANVAELRLADVTPGADIQTQGYIAAGDGGSGRYFGVVAARPKTYVEDGGSTVLPSGGDGSRAWLLDIGTAVDVRQFGATGDGATDDTTAFQAALTYVASPRARTRRLIVPTGAYKISASLVAHGRVQIIGDGSAASVILFHGKGWALDCVAPTEVSGLALTSKDVDQSGLVVIGGLGPRIRDLVITDFDGVGCQLGVAGKGGVYFADVNYVQLCNNVRTGRAAFVLDGGRVPNSNANICQNIFTKGRWTTHYDIGGNANILIGGDAEPNNSAAPIAEVYRIRGAGNKIIGPYVEPGGATIPSIFFRFDKTAQANRIEGVHWTATDHSTYSKIIDLGVNNEVAVNQNGFNFTPSPGRNVSHQNLVPNAGFWNLASDGLPVGWTRGPFAGVIARDTQVVRGGPYSMKFDCTAERASLAASVATAPKARDRLQLVPAGKFRNRTVTAGVWCWSETPDFGAIKITAGGPTVGAASHSGSGAWEFLVASARVEDSAEDVQVVLRSHRDNARTTGVCYFSEPILVLGNEIPQAAMPRPLDDGDAVMAGRFSWNAPALLAVNSATPAVSEANLFTEKSTAPTTIVDFPGGRAGQEIKIIVTSPHLSVASNDKIQTTTGATRALLPSTLCKFVYDGARWYEF